MLTLMSWNVNGIRAVIKKGFLEVLNKYQPDILALQEIKIDDSARSLAGFKFADYNEYWCPAQKKGYSGTAILSKKKPLQIICGLPEKIIKKYNLIDNKSRNSADEGRVITAEYKKFYLVNVYTPNAKDDLSRLSLRHEQWDPAFWEYAKNLEKIKPVIFCGDLNVAHTPDDLARPKENEGNKGYTKEEREGFQKYIDAGFIDAFRLFKKGPGHYTWWTHWANARANNVGWRIDYFLVSKKLKTKIVKAEILDQVTGSDHCPVSLQINL